MIFKKSLIIVTILCLASNVLNVQAEESLMRKWNSALFQAISQSDQGIPVLFRTAFIVHNAMYNAWAHYDAKAISDPLTGFSRQPKDQRTIENKETAISYAAYYTMKALLPDQTPIFDELMRTLGHDTQTFPTDSKSPAGIGARVAKIMIKSRENDNANQLGNLNPSGVPYSEPVLLSGYKPYRYINTVDRLKNVNFWQPQRNADGTAQTYQNPGFGVVKPFAMTDGAQFRAEKGPKRTYTDFEGFIEQAQQIYDISVNLTPRQRLIAIYWDTVLLPNTNIWLAIAAEIGEKDNYGLDEEVKIFFGTSAALFDAEICAWDTKRVYNSVRPITVINKFIDPTWETLPEVPTPPHPDYTAGHAVVAASAAEIYRGFAGDDCYGGSYTDDETGITLSWKTFSDVVEEAGLSRMYAGIHFEDAVKVGQKQGRKVGKAVWEKLQRLFGGK